MRRGRVGFGVWTVAWAASAMALAPEGATAQHAMPELTPIDASEPVARRAGEFLELLITGDQEKARAYLQAHVAPEDLARVADEVHGVVGAIASGGFRVRDFVRAPDHDDIVFARLVSTGGTPEIVGVRVANEPPHRILGLMRVEMQMRHGPER